MKKNLIIICITLLTLSLTAFGCKKNNTSVNDIAKTVNIESVVNDSPVITDVKEKSTPEFVYDVGPRFNSITKKDLLNLKSFNDYIGQEHVNRIVSYKSLSVILLENSQKTDIKLTTDSGMFSTDQLELLKSFDYSTNLMLWADYTEKWEEDGKIEDSYWTPYLTIVPETQAAYKNGKEAMINYLQQNSKELTANLDQDKLKPGQIFFTVTKDGVISNVEIVSTSGFHDLDEKIKALISALPEKWQPAKKANGDNVDQTLTVFYGKMGC